MINIKFVSQARKFLKKCPPELRGMFQKELSAVYDDIEAGIALGGDLAGCYKFKIDYNGQKYRAVYEVINDELVIVVYCGPRKNAYQLIKKSGVLKGAARKRKSK